MAREDKATAITQRICLHLTVQAAALLRQLAPSEHKRGRYISDLIMREAQRARLSGPPAEPTIDDQLVALRERLAELEARLQPGE